MKLYHWLLLITGCVIIGIAWNQHIRATRAEAIVATLEVERDSALVRIVQLEAQAEESQVTVDSLVTELVEQKASSAAEIEVLETRADSLGNALVNAAEPGPARDTTEALVEALFASWDAQKAEYVRLLALSDQTILELQEQVTVEQEINANLRRALDITTQQRDAWAAAANPGLLSKLKTAAVGFAVGAITWEVVR